MSLATREDVERALLRPLQDPEPQYFQGMLDYIEATIRLRRPEVLGRAEESAELALVVRHVEANAVARVLRTEGSYYTQETEGDYSYTVNTAVASGVLGLTDDEWALLLGRGSGWGTITTVGDDYAVRTWGTDLSWRSVPPGAFNDPPRRPFL